MGPSHGFRIRPGRHLSAAAVQRPARPGAGQSGAGQGVRPDNALGTFFFEEKIIKKLGTSANTFFGVFWCEK